jgi:hypothetical protein
MALKPGDNAAFGVEPQGKGWRIKWHVVRLPPI